MALDPMLVLVVPPVAAGLALLATRGRQVAPEIILGLNTVMPGSGLAAAGRPLTEVVLGTGLAVVGALAAGSVGFPAWLATMIAGGFWALFHTPWSPTRTASAGGTASPPLSPSPRHAPSPSTSRPTAAAPAASRPAATAAEDDQDDPADAGYAVSLRCTECGADVEVPVLHRAARCDFCGSEHLVTGQDRTLLLTLPAAVTDESSLREAILDHYRYQYYLNLYRRTVAPLERGSTQMTPDGVMVSRPEVDATAAAAERAVAAKADAYRQRLAGELRLADVTSFYAPYRHGMGTLYQAAFGRDPRDQEKRLEFALATLEASRLASSAIDLPAMGKLSYLRALRSAAELPPDALTFPIEGDDGDLLAAFGQLDRKKLCRQINTIRLGSRFRREVSAVVWRPYWRATVRGGGIGDELLVDGASGTVVGPAPHIAEQAVVEISAEIPELGEGLRFVPMECPVCGDEYPFQADAELHFCRNCHRTCAVSGHHKREVEYDHTELPSDPAAAPFDLVPFWRFPLALATGAGDVLTDMWHLKDGIDGTLDQIGDDAPRRQHAVWVPAIRCINSRLMVSAFVRLFQFTIRQPPAVLAGRFPLDLKVDPWSIGLAEPEARELVPLYLANAFGRRDLARVNVHQVSDWLFEGRQTRPGRLVFAPVPSPVTEPFRAYVGRFRAGALRDAAGLA